MKVGVGGVGATPRDASEAFSERPDERRHGESQSPVAGLMA